MNIVIIIIVIIFLMFCMPSKKEQFNKSDSLICGVKDKKQLWCAWGDISKDPKWNQIKGKIKHISVTNDNELYALDSKGNLYFRDDFGKDYRNPGNWYIINRPGNKIKKFKEIAVSGKLICGVTKKGVIFCYDRTNQVDPKWIKIKSPEDTKIKSVSINDKQLYAISNDNEIYFKKHYKNKGDDVWKLLSNSLKKVSFDGKLVCGIDEDNMIHCFDNGRINNPNWIKIEKKQFNDVLVRDGNLVGVDKHGNIHVAQDYNTRDQDPKWETIPNANGLQQIDLVKRGGLFG
jgi:Tectonin domain